jgi:hypothetical protein
MAWVVEWRTRYMSAPAFWYYRKRGPAERQLESFRRSGSEARIRRVKMTPAVREAIRASKHGRGG